MVIEIRSEEEFYQEIKDGRKIVDFYADWCAPCRALAPILEDYVGEYPDVDVIRVNCDAFPSLARKHGVFSIPFILVYLDGNQRGESTGFLEEEKMFRFLDSALSY